MSPCVSTFHPEYTISSVPWSYELNHTCEYTGWTAHEFFDYFRARFRVMPTYHAASSFASALIMLEAVERTQSFDTQVILDDISRSSFYTFYGNCSFANKLRQCNMRPVVLQKVSRILYPYDSIRTSYIYIYIYVYHHALLSYAASIDINILYLKMCAFVLNNDVE